MASKAWMAACLLLGALFFWNGAATDSEFVQTGSGDSAHAGQTYLTASVTPSKYTTKSIRDLRVGERVLARNPEVSDSERATAIEPDATWKHLQLQMSKPDGSILNIELLRPEPWVTGHAASVGSIIQLDLEEMGAHGPALVQSVSPAPPILSGDGEVITGTFSHSASNVIDLHVEGLSNPIGTTDNHPFWSEDRQKFIPARELKAGERLRTEDGRLLAVAGGTARQQAESVFNLEVNTEHVYYVDSSGILVHNQYTTTAIGRMDDLKRFDDNAEVDTWWKSGRMPTGDEADVTLRENREWLWQRVQRGDSFILATDPATLGNTQIPGQPNGFLTFMELTGAEQ
jgi:hypothetical protein